MYTILNKRTTNVIGIRITQSIRSRLIKVIGNTTSVIPTELANAWYISIFNCMCIIRKLDKNPESRNIQNSIICITGNSFSLYL